MSEQQNTRVGAFIEDRCPKPGAFIQWKGTNVCMDFHCACGASSHVDADFAYAVRCPGCGRLYEMGVHIAAREVPSGTWADRPVVDGEPWS